MPVIEIVLILGFALVGICGLISAKLKHDNRKKWWLPLLIGGVIFLMIICYFLLVAFYFASFFQAHCAPYLD